MFEKASRLKLRFDTEKGKLTTEDLWELPLTSQRGHANLDDIARGLNRDLKASAEESFVVKATTGNALLQLKLDVAKHVIDVKLAENEVAKNRADAKEKKERILAIIAKKQDEQLEGSSLEDLQAMIASL